MNNTDALARAEDLARRAHVGQVDKTGAPYIEHPLRVAAKLDDQLSKVVALLHDVIEDTDITEAHIRREFGDVIAEAVVAMTHPTDEPRVSYYARVRANPIALRVKAADIHDNLDPARLAALDPATRQRLVLKYSAALRALYEDAGSAAPPATSSSTTTVRLVNPSGPTSIHVDARIDVDGSLLLSGQDVGAGPVSTFGDSDYEYWLRIPASAKDEALLALLEALYSGDAAVVGKLKALLESKGIECKFTSYA